jgi:hypothetical protein
MRAEKSGKQPIKMQLDDNSGAIALGNHLQQWVPIHATFLQMLQEHHSHCSERRGCGYTQSTRWLAELINRPRSNADLVSLGGGELHAWCKALRSFQAKNDGQLILQNLLQDLLQNVTGRSTIDSSFVPLARDSSAVPLARDSAVLHPIAPEKLKIGTCPLAEQFFLELACGKIRRGGSIHVIVDAAQATRQTTPLLLEKRGLGDEHSAITVVPVRIHDVTLPPGTLIGLAYDDAILPSLQLCQNGRGRIIPLDQVLAFRYLRLTTLAAAPSERKRIFTAHFEQQIQNNLFLPDSARIEDLLQFAEAQLP